MTHCREYNNPILEMIIKHSCLVCQGNEGSTAVVDETCHLSQGMLSESDFELGPSQANAGCSSQLSIPESQPCTALAR